MKYTIALLGLSLTLSACAVPASDPAAERQAEATRTLMDNADRKIGMPALSEFAEKATLRDVYELRDKINLVTYVYLQGLDGKLVCLGKGQGYGVPYGAQFTAPKALQYVRPRGRGDNSDAAWSTELMDQPEPNGLYMPSTANATWIKMVDPDTGKLTVMYVEPNLVVSPFRVKGAAVSVDCPT